MAENQRALVIRSAIALAEQYPGTPDNPIEIPTQVIFNAIGNTSPKQSFSKLIRDQLLKLEIPAIRKIGIKNRYSINQEFKRELEDVIYDETWEPVIGDQELSNHLNQDIIINGVLYTPKEI